MPQINTGLKRVFTIFNIFFAVVGAIIIGLALMSQAITSGKGGESLEGRTTGLIVLYVVGSITMVIAILGAYGAHKESKPALIVFLVCMVIGSLLMLRMAIPTALARPELEDVLEEKFRELLPLDQAAGDVQHMAESLQTQMHCCGLFSYKDWETNVPDSCECDPQVSESDECKQITYSVMMTSKYVYAKPCFPILMHYILLVADVMLAVVLTLAVLAILGMILSSVMIHQMRYANRPPVMLTVPAVFTPALPKYHELHNPPGY